MENENFPSLLLSSLGLSDTNVYESEIRARLGTAAHFCEVGVLKLRTVPIDTALSVCVCERESDRERVRKRESERRRRR